MGVTSELQEKTCCEKMTIKINLRGRFGGQFGCVPVVLEDCHGGHELIVGEDKGREDGTGEACG